MLQLTFLLLIPSTVLTHIRLPCSCPSFSLRFVITVICHIGCKQQVREINNAIAFVIVACDNVTYSMRFSGKSYRFAESRAQETLHGPPGARGFMHKARKPARAVALHAS